MIAPGYLGGHDAGVGHVVDYIAHAAIWAAVSHFVRQLPGGWLLIVVVVAALVIVRRWRRRRRFTPSSSRWSTLRLERRVRRLESERRDDDGLPPHPADGMGGRPWRRRS